MDYNNYNNGPEEGEKSGFRKIYLFAALGVLALVVVVAFVVLIAVIIKDNKYNSALAAGNAYYTAGDYENAIQQYKLAISIDGDKSAAFANLASAYCGIGDYDSALYVLQYGINATHDTTLDERLSKVQTLANFTLQENQVNAMTPEEITRISNNTTIENTIFDIIAAYTYTEYTRDYGQFSDKTVDQGRVTLFYANVDMKTIYYDLQEEKVIDMSGTMPVAAVKPCVVTLTKLDRLFTCKDSYFVISFARLQEMFGRGLELKHDEAANRYYVTCEYKNCRVSIQTDREGRVVSTTAWNEIVPLFRGAVEEESNGDGSISGYVQDAMTGRPMKATIKVRNRGVRTGGALYEAETGSDGSYKYEGATGTYTMEVSAVGYNSEFIDFEIMFGQTKAGVNVVLAPISNGEIRIVLTWGAFPEDLDSHAEGRSSGGRSFHIYFSNSSESGVGNLDVDDTSAYGPETITIMDANSEFSYYVVDFTHSGRMNASGATVKVYLPDGTMQTFTINSSGSGNRWNVFDYKNGQITVRNTMQQ